MKRVEIRVKGQLDKEWSGWLEGLAIKHGTHDETTLKGVVADQSALYGLLSKLRDLGLELIAVNSVDHVQEV
jgi:hypothetical protein